MEQKRVFFCKGCRNACKLEIVMVDGKVVQVIGGGCRRAETNAKRYLEKIKKKPCNAELLKNS